MSGIDRTLKGPYFFGLYLLLLLLYAPVFYFEKFYYLHLALLLPMLLFSVCSPPLFWLFSLLIAVAEAVYAHIARNWGGLIDSRIDVALASPADETREYIADFVGLFDGAIMLYLALVLLAIRLYQKRFGPRKRPECGKTPLFLTLAAFLIVGKNVPPLKFYKVLYQAQKRMAFVKTREKNLEKWLKTHTIDTIESPYKTILIVIGESAERHHHGIYGYHRATTPFLTSLHPYVFDGIAPSNQTRLSVPLILGDWDVDHWERFYTAPSIVSILKASGYRTYWISNQRMAGKNDTMSATLAKEADEYHFPNTASHKELSRDEIILEKMGKIHFTDGKKALFIHLRGSHQRYSDRYAPAIVPFSGETTTDRYDNTIYYTDHILSRLYERFKGKDFLMVYFSDHGERVSDTEKSFHGFDPPFRDEYDIPFIVHSGRDNSYLDDLNRTEVYLDDFTCLLRNILQKRETCRLRDSDKVFVVSEHKTAHYHALNYSKDLKKILQSDRSFYPRKRAKATR